MVFYKGALTYAELEAMPIPRIFELNDLAARINREREARLKKDK